MKLRGNNSIYLGVEENVNETLPNLSIQSLILEGIMLYQSSHIH